MKLKRALIKKAEESVPREPGPCLNCGTQMESGDLFCPHCGQKCLERHDMSFRHLIMESFLDYFHFDSKFFLTMKFLIFRPGQLTLEFMRGKRKTFVAPFRLFLVISIIFFLLLPFSKETPTDNATNVKASSNGLHFSKPGNNSQNLRFTLKNVTVSKAGQDSIRNEIDSLGLKAYINKKFPEEGSITKFFMGQVYKIMINSGQSITTVIEHTASKMVFLLIPVFALLLKLLYIHQKHLYFEHLIFSLHVHAFIFLLLILNLLTAYFFSVNNMVIVLIAVIYSFFAVKKQYGQSIRKTLLKFSLLSLSYLIIALPVFFIILMLVAFLVY